jgi:RNA polymerase sigma factor (sigma-70 family)
VVFSEILCKVLVQDGIPLLEHAAMAESPTTHVSLLVRLGDPQDRAAWDRFVGLYAPLLYQFFRRRGLQDADAADVTQDVFRVVSQKAAAFAYDGTVGSFRAWLYEIARNKLRHFQTRQERQSRNREPAADDLLAAAVARDDEGEGGGAAYEQSVFAWASQRVQARVDARTWQAFWQTAVEGRSGEEVAAALGLSVGAVYVAKSRTMTRLKKVVEEIQATEDD